MSLATPPKPNHSSLPCGPCFIQPPSGFSSLSKIQIHPLRHWHAHDLLCPGCFFLAKNESTNRPKKWCPTFSALTSTAHTHSKDCSTENLLLNFKPCTPCPACPRAPPNWKGNQVSWSNRSFRTFTIPRRGSILYRPIPTYWRRHSCKHGPSCPRSYHILSWLEASSSFASTTTATWRIRLGLCKCSCFQPTGTSALHRHSTASIASRSKNCYYRLPSLRKMASRRPLQYCPWYIEQKASSILASDRRMVTRDAQPFLGSSRCDNSFSDIFTSWRPRLR